jgi:hypothetical protein
MMTRHRLPAVVLALVCLGVLAARPGLTDLQAQIDALSMTVAGIPAPEVVFASSVADTSTQKSATAQCPPGKVVTGGGARTTYLPGSGRAGQVVYQSYPATDDSWTASADAPSVTAIGWAISVWAICITP